MNPATQKKHSKARRRPDLRGTDTTGEGKECVWCTGCKREWSSANWASHCTKYHPDKVTGKHTDEAGADDGDDGADLLEQLAPVVSDVVSLEPKRHQKPDKPHPKVAASKHGNEI